jgi:hypothetical protein
MGHMEIAQTIKSQIGMRTLMYVGANQFGALGSCDEFEAALQFKCKGTHVKRGGRCIVRLNWKDEYEVIVGKTGAGFGWKEIGRVDGVHAAELAQAVEAMVG